MSFFKQTETKYKTILLGFGTGSIYDFGCYLVSLTNGLQQKGYGYEPEGVNNILKSKNLFTGSTKNLIDVNNIVPRWGDIFTSFKRIDNWGSVPSVSEIIKDDLIAIGEVDAAGVGGTLKGQHFVLVTSKGDNGHAIVYDPWRGVEEDISVHWGNLGYIKGLRLFGVKPHIETPTPQPNPVVITDQTKIPQIVDENGNPMEVQRIRSELTARQNKILELSNKLNQIKSIVN